MRIALAITVLVLAGCGTTYTHPQKTGQLQYTVLAPDAVAITYEVPAYTKPAEARDMVMLKAADLCIAAGYSYVAVREQTTGNGPAAYGGNTSTVAATARFYHAERNGAMDSGYLRQSIRTKYGLTD